LETSPPAPDALSAQLQAIAAQVARDFPEYSVAAEAFIARLAAARAGQGAPPVGAPMPSFALPDVDGGLAMLDAYRGRPLVVTFLRGHWCDFCRAQAAALAASAEDFHKAGASVVLITPELPRFSKPLAPAGSGFSLLCDLDNGYAASLGLLAAVDEALAAHLSGFAIDLPTTQGTRGWAVPIPATFVLDGQSTILFRTFDPDFRRRPSLQSVFDAIAKASV
jgi:peroxiredoxin